jgi:ankyrin repeat protein
MKRFLLIFCCLMALLLLTCGFYIWGRMRIAARNAALVAAVENRNFVLVARLLDAGANPNCRRSDGVASGPLAYFRSLIRPRDGQSVLAVAVYFPPGNVHSWPIVEALIQQGAEVDADLGTHALHSAAADGAASLVRLLLDRGLPVDGLDFDGRSALVLAVCERKSEVVDLLLERGADLQKVLVPYAQTITLNGRHVRPIDIYSPAQWNGRIVQTLVRHGLSVETRLAPERPLLTAAVLAGDQETVSFLLQQGADPNVKDSLGWTGLYYAEIQSRKAIAEILRTAGAIKYW